MQTHTHTHTHTNLSPCMCSLCVNGTGHRWYVLTYAALLSGFSLQNHTHIMISWFRYMYTTTNSERNASIPHSAALLCICLTTSTQPLDKLSVMSTALRSYYSLMTALRSSFLVVTSAQKWEPDGRLAFLRATKCQWPNVFLQTLTVNMEDVR